MGAMTGTLTGHQYERQPSAALEVVMQCVSPARLLRVPFHKRGAAAWGCEAARPGPFSFRGTQRRFWVPVANAFSLPSPERGPSLPGPSVHSQFLTLDGGEEKVSVGP